LYEDARRSIAANDIDGAIARYDEILQRFPDTQAAQRARDEVLLYTGLSNAKQSFPLRRTRELMVEAGRALERYHGRRRAWPDSLDELIPEYLAEPPVDPWGRMIAYERKGRGYRLRCLGEDGREGGTGDAGDWLVENGRFVRVPRGG